VLKVLEVTFHVQTSVVLAYSFMAHTRSI